MRAVTAHKTVHPRVTRDALRSAPRVVCHKGRWWIVSCLFVVCLLCLDVFGWVWMRLVGLGLGWVWVGFGLGLGWVWVGVWVGLG